MNKSILAILFIFALIFVHTAADEHEGGGIKGKIHDGMEKIEDKIKEKLHMGERTMPSKAGEAAQDAHDTLHHAENAVKEGVEAVKSHGEGIKDKIHHAYDAVKEAVKGLGSAKDAAIDTQEVPIEAAKDAAKEGVNIHHKHESLKEKAHDAKEFVKDELNSATEKVKEGLHGHKKEEEAEEEEKKAGIADKIKDAVSSVGDKIKSAVGLGNKEGEKSDDHETEKEKKQGKSVDERITEAGKKDEGLSGSITDKIIDAVSNVGDKIKSAVGLGKKEGEKTDDEDKKAEDKKDKDL